MSVPEIVEKVREDAHQEADRGTPLQCSALEAARVLEAVWNSGPTARLILSHVAAAK